MRFRAQRKQKENKRNVSDQILYMTWIKGRRKDDKTVVKQKVEEGPMQFYTSLEPDSVHYAPAIFLSTREYPKMRVLGVPSGFVRLASRSDSWIFDSSDVTRRI